MSIRVLLSILHVFALANWVEPAIAHVCDGGDFSKLLAPGESHEFLGEGAYGTVFKVTSPDGTIFVRKLYRSEVVCAIDAHALKILEGAAAQFPSIRAVKVLGKSGKELKLTYTAGHTMEDLLRKGALSQAKRLILNKNYNNLIQDLETYFRRNHRIANSDRIRDRDGTMTFTADVYDQGTIVKFFIKPDNVVVNPDTLEVTVIDPF